MHTQQLSPPLLPPTHTQDTAQDIGLAIQECLRLMSAAYKGVQGQNAIIVEALLLENIYSVSSCLLHHNHHPSPLRHPLSPLPSSPSPPPLPSS